MSPHGVFMALALVGALVGQASAEAPPLKVTTSRGGGRLALSLEPLDGFELNARAPASRRLVLTLPGAPPRVFDADDFSHEGARASIVFQAEAAPPAELVALLCREDRCRRVALTIEW